MQLETPTVPQCQPGPCKAPVLLHSAESRCYESPSLISLSGLHLFKPRANNDRLLVRNCKNRPAATSWLVPDFLMCSNNPWPETGACQFSDLAAISSLLNPLRQNVAAAGEQDPEVRRHQINVPHASGAVRPYARCVPEKSCAAAEIEAAQSWPVLPTSAFLANSMVFNGIISNP